ncbi:MAG: PEP-utilizing enzyme [Patescibacteria group bacterium]|jgi:pyruvate,water dikinase
MINKIKKITWLAVFSRAGFPYFIVDLAINAYVLDMKKRLSWGYRDQLMLIRKNLITSYYSKRDEDSFKEWLKKQNEKKLEKINNIILKQLKESKNYIAKTNKLLKNENSLITSLDYIYKAYYNLYAIYRFPTILDTNNKNLVSNELIKKFASTKDKCGFFFGESDSSTLKEFNKLASKKLKLASYSALDMSYKELRESLLKNKVSVSKKILEQRLNKFIFAVSDKKSKVYYGKQVDSLIKTLEKQDNIKSTSLKGQIAYPGKIKAKVLIAKSVDDLKNYKFKTKIILVAPMTTTYFIPYIKNVSAIITDEGGITCHAAILAREFKKPCLIGTRYATKIFKNGDLVEVDTDKGIVKILEKL